MKCLITGCRFLAAIGVRHDVGYPMLLCGSKMPGSPWFLKTTNYRWVIFRCSQMELHNDTANYCMYRLPCNEIIHVKPIATYCNGILPCSLLNTHLTITTHYQTKSFGKQLFEKKSTTLGLNFGNRWQWYAYNPRKLSCHRGRTNHSVVLRDIYIYTMYIDQPSPTLCAHNLAEPNTNTWVKMVKMSPSSGSGISAPSWRGCTLWLVLGRNFNDPWKNWASCLALDRSCRGHLS